MNWQPIETAPKDRPIALKTASGCAIAQWSEMLEDENGKTFFSFKEGWAAMIENYMARAHDELIEVMDPTHWAEL